MSWLAACGLSVLRFLHFLWTIFTALLYYPFLANPLPLEISRKSVPKTLALVLETTSQEKLTENERNAIVKSVIRTVRWCRISGIHTLSVYDHHNNVIRLSNRIKAALLNNAVHEPSESEYSSATSDSERLPSPPAANVTDSRAISPDNWCSPPSIITMDLDADLIHVQQTPLRRRQVANSHPRRQNKKSPQMTLSLVSNEASKALLASIARKFAASGKPVDQGQSGIAESHGISVESIDRLVQESLHLDPPDLMIVHSVRQRYLSCPPLELYGFPPWLMRLTEIYHDCRPSLYRAWKGRGNKRSFVPLSEETFRRALDTYAHADMRFGK